MKNLFPSWIRVPVIFFTVFGLIEYFVDSGDKPAFLEQPMIMLFLALVLLILIATEAIVSALDNLLYQSLDAKGKERYNLQKEKTPKFIGWIKSVYKKLVGTKPIEEEHDIILDHNYDGIRELDNSLPPWWLYGFYASIIFAFVYLAKYHIFNGQNQFEEYEATVAQAEKDYQEYLKTAKNLVDFNTVEVLTDASDLAKGKKIFTDNCVACHKDDGGGSIGPNLTDEYWILGGGIKNIFKTISEGSGQNPSMIAWKQSLEPAQIAQVASYVLQFQGTTAIGGKDPEGELWVDPDVEVQVESTEVATDSIQN